MGFLDSLLSGEEGKADQSTGNEGNPLKLMVSFSPVRLSAMKENRINMLVKLTNLTDQEQMVSVDVLLPKNGMVGFEPTCINKHGEKKIGKVAAGETKEIVIPVYGTSQTKPGNYPFKVVAYIHYLDFTKVLNQVSKMGELRVV
jgi:uncharacterized membrane protein